MAVSLSKELRNQLARVTLDAREKAEAASKAALENLAVHEKDYRLHMAVEMRQLRNRLRARGRAFGDRLDTAKGTQEIRRLVELVAYENWHRLLFTRFLTENNLLISDEQNGSVPVTLADCYELAPSLGARDGFDLACRFASRILPGVFRSDDPALEVVLAPNDRVALKQLLDSLPVEMFRADDSLGWTYQFWQAKRKDEVNASGNKIGADEIAAVTQLFTEDYMVEFLLHNTIGAWWAGKKAQVSPFNIKHYPTEADARRMTGLVAKGKMPAIEWTYLRFIKDKDEKNWIPAAGVFDGWPKTVKEIRFLDPCMGSGHFLIFVLPIFARLRMEEEKLTPAQAITEVVRDNLFGLEIDERCTQIAAFNVALTAWKLGGYQKLPPLHLACSGIAPRSKLQDWVKLAGNDGKAKSGMEKLYKLFEQAPILGSLINLQQDKDLLVAGFDEIKPLVEKALADEREDENRHEIAVTAQGIAKAAEILAGQFTLVTTNVPYLGRGKQDDVLMDFCERVHSEAKTDLATCFVERCLDFCDVNGSTVLVTPQNWLFLGSYRELREKLLPSVRWDFVSRLGPKGFQTQMWDFNIMLIGLSRARVDEGHKFAGIDVTQETSPESKMKALLQEPVMMVVQLTQLKNPDCRVMQRDGGTSADLLSERAEAFQGLITGDRNSFIFRFWEVEKLTCEWEIFIDGFSGHGAPLGRENIIHWENGNGRLYQLAEVNRDRLHDMHESGNLSWGKKGILLTRIGLRATPHYGERYDNNLICIMPFKPKDLSALWNFCSSVEYRDAVRELDQKLSLTNATACKVGVNLDDWSGQGTFPLPETVDPTQWLFNGHPKGSDHPLHVAVTRLLGYRWPRQTGSSFPDCPALKKDGLEAHADADGIVCLSGLNREQPAASRLRSLLADALGKFDERALISATGSDTTTLEDWLRDDFFEEHCSLFHHRPFVWHIWDGRKDGFNVLVNYHKLDSANLQKLAYTYLGDWIRKQDEDAKADKPGAAERLGAAKALQTELANILKGEPPYDIFVRWKSLSQQSIGWKPDVNDGVRLNIRPFLQAKDIGKRGAGILRSKPNIKWDKDRGKEPQRDKKEYPWFWCEEEPGTDPIGGKEFIGNRWNDVHLTVDMKKMARKD